MRRVGIATGTLAAAGLLAQLLALVRELYVAGRVGASPQLDALLVSLALPTVATGLLTGSLRAALLPAYLDIRLSAGPAAARQLMGAVITWIAMIGAVFTILLLLLGDAAVWAAGPGLDVEAHRAAVGFLAILAPVVALSAVAAVLSALCQVAQRFNAIGVSLIVNPLTSLVVTLALWRQLGLAAFAFGIALGAVATLLTLLVAVTRGGLMPAPVLRADRQQIRRLVGHAGPLAAGSSVLQFNVLADRSIASFLSAGAVSALRFGHQLALEPLASVSTAWSTVIFPTLVHASRSGDRASAPATIDISVRYILAVYVPITVASVALAPVLVDLVYRRGAFGPEAALMTTSVVVAFAPMLLVTMIQPIITGAHNAARRGRLLGGVAVLNAGLNVLLNVVLGSAIGVGGIALSTTLTTAILLVFLTARLVRLTPGLDWRSWLFLGGRALVASLLPAIPIGILAWTTESRAPGWDLLVIALAAVPGGIAYVVAARLLGVSQPALIVQRAGGWIRQAARVAR